VHNHCRHFGPLRFLCVASVFASAVAPAWAETSAPSFALIAHAGRYPSSVGIEDPARSTVGIVYAAHPGQDVDAPAVGGYATAFLISACHAITSGLAIDAIAPHARTGHAATADDGALIFSLVAMDEQSTSVQARAWRSTVIASRGQLAEWPTSPAWALLRLEDCEADPVAPPAPLSVSAAPKGTEPVYRTRQLGILTARTVAESDAAAAWSMLGGPLQTFDADSRQWKTIGIAIAPNPERAGNPATSTMKSDFLVAGADDGATSFFRYEPQILPLSEIWDQIGPAIEQDLMLGRGQATQSKDVTWGERPRS
jgi:hypothetical protein